MRKMNALTTRRGVDTSRRSSRDLGRTISVISAAISNRDDSRNPVSYSLAINLRVWRGTCQFSANTKQHEQQSCASWKELHNGSDDHQLVCARIPLS